MKISLQAGLLALLSTAAAQVKIMPLGDSITEITCWRSYVWDQLSNAGLAGRVDFVGSMSNNPQNCRASTGNFDVNHEGHSGWQGVDIANNNLPGWLNQFRPDIVQFMLGTNDITIGGKSVDQVIAAYTKMVGQMRASNPNIKIIIDKVIPYIFNGHQTRIDDLNNRINGWAAGLSTTQSPIVIADCSAQAGFTQSMLRDGIHPNDAGDRFMASKIGPLLVQTVRQITG
jgi:lysophospholipase L1-like esterase